MGCLTAGALGPLEKLRPGEIGADGGLTEGDGLEGVEGLNDGADGLDGDGPE